MVKIIDIPISRQEKNYTCGVAVVKSIFEYFETKISEEKLAKILKSTNKEGTNHNAIYNLIKKVCYCEQLKYLNNKDIEKSINMNHPIIVLLQAWNDKSKKYDNEWNSGHYAIIIGFDNDKFYFMDPSSTKYAFIKKDEFVKRWHDKDRHEKLRHFGIIIEWKFHTIQINDKDIIKMK